MRSRFAQWPQNQVADDEHFYRKIIHSDEVYLHLDGYQGTMEKLMYTLQVTAWYRMCNPSLAPFQNGDVKRPPCSCDLTPLDYSM